MKLYFIFVIMTILNLFSETPTWTKEWNINNLNKFIVINSSDNGYIIGRETWYHSGGPSAPVTEYVGASQIDSLGNTLWSNCFYVDTYWGADMYSMLSRTDGSFFFTGYLNMHGTLSRISEGEEVFRKSFSGSSEVVSILESDDNNLILLFNGISKIMKTTTEGDVVWEQELNGSRNKMLKTIDNGYIASGMINSKYDEDIAIAKIASHGDIVWEKFIHHHSLDSSIKDFIEGRVSDSYIIYYYLKGASGADYTIVAKLNGFDGSIVWSQTFSGLIKGVSVGSLEDDYILLFDTKVQSVNESGELYWEKALNTIEGENTTIIKGYHDDYIIMKYNEIISINRYGETNWIKSLYNNGSCSIIKTNDGGYLVAGQKEVENLWLTKTDSYGNCSGIEESKSTISQSSLIKNYPNPFNPTTTISYKLDRDSDVELFVMDILGKEIKKFTKGIVTSGTHQVKFNGSDLATGVYIYSLKINGNVVDTKKMVLVK